VRCAAEADLRKRSDDRQVCASVVVGCAAAVLQPCGNGGPRRFKQLKLGRPPGFLLDDRNPCPHTVTAGEIANSNLDDVTPPQLAVDGEVEEGSIGSLCRSLSAQADDHAPPDLVGSCILVSANSGFGRPSAQAPMSAGGSICEGFPHIDLAIFPPDRPGAQSRCTRACGN